MALSERTRRRIPRLSFLGTPVHPPLTDIPVALLFAAPMFDAAALARDSDELGAVGFWNTAGGVASTLPTALTGLLDYLRVPADAPGKGKGTVHGLMNSAALGLSAASLWLRRDRPERPTPASLALSSASAAIVTVSAHIGGLLVFEEGFRAERARPLREPEPLSTERQGSVGDAVEAPPTAP
jgi:uncharacterized membrane protein